ncbi:MAG: YicC family protein [Planctomycetales bacterium]|nr:YicC family protein [Planctomycetales bacterium]
MPLLSMTGFGDARQDRGEHAVGVEVRTINSRHLKLNLRTTEGYGALDAKIESAVRETIRRGTVYVNVRIRHLSAADDFRINTDVLETYLDQLQRVAARRDLDERLRLEPLARLPGVVEEASTESRSPDAVWPLVESTLRAALANLADMRAAEGKALAADLTAQCAVVAQSLEQIAVRSPEVSESYRQRLLERVNEALAPAKVALSAADLVREVCLFVDRSDITEEIVRLRSHLQQFSAAMGGDDSVGRRLEFICQEMGRETNTIGSKANDGEITQHVVGIKTALERIREQIQNVE